MDERVVRGDFVHLYAEGTFSCTENLLQSYCESHPQLVTDAACVKPSAQCGRQSSRAAAQWRGPRLLALPAALLLVALGLVRPPGARLQLCRLPQLMQRHRELLQAEASGEISGRLQSRTERTRLWGRSFYWQLIMVKQSEPKANKPAFLSVILLPPTWVVWGDGNAVSLWCFVSAAPSSSFFPCSTWVPPVDAIFTKLIPRGLPQRHRAAPQPPNARSSVSAGQFVWHLLTSPTDAAQWRGFCFLFFPFF